MIIISAADREKKTNSVFQCCYSAFIKKTGVTKLITIASVRLSLFSLAGWGRVNPLISFVKRVNTINIGNACALSFTITIILYLALWFTSWSSIFFFSLRVIFFGRGALCACEGALADWRLSVARRSGKAERETPESGTKASSGGGALKRKAFHFTIGSLGFSSFYFLPKYEESPESDYGIGGCFRFGCAKGKVNQHN